ncbi:hypothetical protein SQ03_28135 [Methylobacterium platani JCM 14648]|uniref:Serine dehydrogenasease n=1 Tax=Methylobacterium platani JCM 14648 TaxID=1295136 RepID=A0ABR5GQ41_9HYPH|nr:hypothetical protein SQ03_28135 [Methylobacterium platani JCM 14648]
METELCTKIKDIGDYIKADVISLMAPMQHNIVEWVRECIEEIKEKRDRLIVILETEGGSIQVVERIADLLRHHYPNEVSFLIPSHAMSAGTVLAMSGDNIYMDYFSILGPIDPQIVSRSKGDIYIPALGYLQKYEELISKSKKNTITDAEIAFLIAKFDPAELYHFEQARDLSVELLKKWLVKYKFKNWVTTRTKKIPVTPDMKEEMADSIAKKLNDIRRWKSHDRGLTMRVIDKEINLSIEDFGLDKDLNDKIRSYYRLLQDYMITVRQSMAIHTAERYRGN